MKYFHATEEEAGLFEKAIDALAKSVSHSPESALEYLRGVGVVPDCMREDGLQEDQMPQPDGVQLDNASDATQQNNINQTSEP